MSSEDQENANQPAAPQFDRQAFKLKFNQLDTQNEGRLDKYKIEELMNAMDCSQYQASIAKNINKFYLHSKKNELSTTSHTLIKEKEGDDEEEEEQNQQVVDEIENVNYKLSLEEAMLYMEMLSKTIKYQLWKKTATIIQLLNQLMRLSKRSQFPLKDPGHNVNINLIVGDQLPNYNSRVHAKIQKKAKPVNASALYNKQNIQVKIKIITRNMDESKLLDATWQEVYTVIKSIVQGEMPDGKQFLQSISVTTTLGDNFMEIRVKVNNPDITLFIKTIVEFGDKIFKTELRFILELFLDSNFDLDNVMTEKNVSIYHFLTKDIKIKFQYISSEFVTALKQLMIASKAFEGLSYVSDDDDSLIKIFLVCCQEINLNLRFKNSVLVNPQQQTLKQILGMLMGLRNMIFQLKQEMPEVAKMITNILNNKIQIQAQLLSIFINVDINLPGLQTLIMKDSPLMEGVELEND